MWCVYVYMQVCSRFSCMETYLSMNNPTCILVMQVGLLPVSVSLNDGSDAACSEVMGPQKIASEACFRLPETGRSNGFGGGGMAGRGTRRIGNIHTCIYFYMFLYIYICIHE